MKPKNEFKASVHNMIVIPAINCNDKACIKNSLRKLAGIAPEWVHVDVIDGEFTSPATYMNSDAITEASEILKTSKYEIHLMVNNPLQVMEPWLQAGVKRIIVHVEAITMAHKDLEDMCKKYGASLMLAFRPGTPVSRVLPFTEDISEIQVLAVHPGRSGQPFEQSVLEKVQFLRKIAPHLYIEVDGGINLKTAGDVKRAGADAVVSASYLFDSWFIGHAYKKLARAAA